MESESLIEWDLEIPRDYYKAKGEKILEKYRYDASNRLLELERITTNLEALENHREAVYFSYDKQGNMLTDGSFNYEYDELNRLVSATGINQTANAGKKQCNRYDAEGLRHEMEENGKLVRFIYSEKEMVAEEDSNGEILRYIRGLGIVASDTEKARTYYHYKETADSDSNTLYYHYYNLDAQDSVTHIVDENGILNQYEYDVFGNVICSEEKVANRFGYTGQQLDPVTQQYYLRARFYNPVIARFLQEDTYLGDGLNLFTYVQNNPLKYYDPSGHACETKYNAYKKSSEQGISLQEPLEAYRDSKTSKYSETEIKNIIDNLQSDGFKTNPLRMAYEQEVADLASYSEELMRGGYSAEETARIVNQARRDLGIKYKNMTPQPLRDYIYEINIKRYGDKLGPSYEWLVCEKGSTNLEIINSSSRPNANIDKLLAGFEEWLRRQ